MLCSVATASLLLASRVLGIATPTQRSSSFSSSYSAPPPSVPHPSAPHQSIRHCSMSPAVTSSMVSTTSNSIASSISSSIVSSVSSSIISSVSSSVPTPCQVFVLTTLSLTWVSPLMHSTPSATNFVEGGDYGHPRQPSKNSMGYKTVQAHNSQNMPKLAMRRSASTL